MKGHYKVVRVSAKFLTMLMTENETLSAVHVDQGVPKDATFVRGFFDEQRKVYGAIFEHPAWDEVDLFECDDWFAALPAIAITFSRMDAL